MKRGIWTKYGMTEAQYKIFLSIKPGCWICGRMKKNDGSPVKLFTDHDHATGRVRGRLDYPCNRRLIGRRRDGDLYRRAADYLDSTFDGRNIETQTESGKAPKAKTRAAKVRLRRQLPRTDDDARQ